MKHSPFSLFQAAVLLGQLGGSPIDGFSSDCPLLTTIPPDNRSQSAPRTPLPLPDKRGNFGWQPGSCTLAASASYDAVYSVHHDGIPLGHDTCSRMKDSPFLLFQSTPLGPSFTAADRRMLWESLQAVLNAEGPAQKTVQEWQAFWRKERFTAENILTEMRDQQRGTGGGQLSGFYGRVLEIIGRSRADGSRSPVYQRSEALVPPHESLQARATVGELQPRTPVLPSPASLRVSAGDMPGTSGVQDTVYAAPALPRHVDTAPESPSAPAPLQQRRRRRSQTEGTRRTELGIETLLARSNKLHEESNRLRAELRDVGTRQADALEQLVAETRRQREASEREAGHLAEAVRELRSIGELSRALTASLRRRPAQE
ncbi:hypothetical protein HPB50_009050 [Hyalomma asiaticum]|uniref:Uncharacterized protein n=1 Tax=Hyalomma asiaticum TaxID=266040 RepID=A0ACB7SFP9_HYAAI|nr:hypothetical protein HPB50_009050 [Hyalomma asiaticum]